MSALPSIDGSVTEWTNDMFSPELQAAIRDIVPVTDRDFDKHDFNPVAYINDNFSNEQSLTRLDNFMNRLKLKIIKIDEEIIQEVRLQSISGGKGKEDLENAKRSINELLTKITDIKSKANQSEQMVTEICKDIKSLDYAKKNLTTAITTLKRLHMMVMGVEQLKEMVDKKQYGTVAKLLEATAQFAEGFKDYRESPKIYALNKELDNIRSRVKDQIYEDFNQYVPYTSNQIKPNEENRWKSSCYVIDALGSEVKKDFLRWFCGSQLSSYKKAFGSQSESYTLDSTDRRFGWWSRQIKIFREEYALVFPPEWCMEEQISYEFCILTRLDLSEVLLINKNSIEVPQLIKALKKTLTFENKLYELFAQNNQKLSSPTMSSTPSNESENNSDDSDQDDSDDDNGENQVDGENNSNNNNKGNSEDAIRRRWEARVEKDRKREEEKLQQQQLQQQQQQGKDVNKQQQQQQQPIEIPKSYERFKGIISSSFDPYMDLYINEEDKLIGEVLEKVMAEEKWTLSDEEANKILTSCTDLVFHFIKVRNRCAELTKGEPFFNLYHLFRKYLTQYANIISGKIHTDVGRAHDVQEDKTICLIINTAEFCRKTSGQMTDGFKKIIDEKYKESIDLKDIQNDFSSIIAKGVKALVSGIEAKLDPHLQSMTRMEWGERYQYVGDNSPYVNEVVQIISDSSQLEVAWLSPEHFRYFCDLFASSFGLRIPQSIYKCRGISEIGSQGILLDITTIKTVLLDLPNKVKDGRSNSRYTKLLNKEFAKAENLLKVIGCSQDHLVETFKDLFPDSTNADFQKIMDLKGFKVGDKIQTELFEKLSKVSTNIGASIKTKFFN
ncbi:Vps53-like domain-containing protein [Dictyostelium discoideum AX4]|uniref:Vps53-like domain-containing protein n=1 Tax=Dictyostelium discoideum TaxID=44689 RepID=Q54MJ6_DICDI|nr:Vps53-like domain-containing protein [Dictyostelium discoideum AX4]EAL64485.1 Vps53-like domain-containing protein [Dictyostelium discoideum AX4]|eukprot:XP_637994.1 Vps53-like domain-containing protein [Dictyostelium discoideum AX4]